MSVGGNPVQFDIIALLTRAWNILTANAAVLVVGALVMWLAQIAIQSISTKILGRLGGMTELILTGPFMLGYFTVALRASRNQPIDFAQLFSGFQRFLPAFVANLIMSILTTIGFCACIIPGILLTALWCLTYLFMTDKNLDFWPSMEASRTTVMLSLMQWVLLIVVLGVINIVGGIVTCGIGLLVTSPLSAITLALAYDQANSQADYVPA